MNKKTGIILTAIGILITTTLMVGCLLLLRNTNNIKESGQEPDNFSSRLLIFDSSNQDIYSNQKWEITFPTYLEPLTKPYFEDLEILTLIDRQSSTELTLKPRYFDMDIIEFKKQETSIIANQKISTEPMYRIQLDKDNWGYVSVPPFLQNCTTTITEGDQILCSLDGIEQIKSTLMCQGRRVHCDRIFQSISVEYQKIDVASENNPALEDKTTTKLIQTIPEYEIGFLVEKDWKINVISIDEPIWDREYSRRFRINQNVYYLSVFSNPDQLSFTEWIEQHSIEPNTTEYTVFTQFMKPTILSHLDLNGKTSIIVKDESLGDLVLVWAAITEPESERLILLGTSQKDMDSSTFVNLTSSLTLGAEYESPSIDRKTMKELTNLLTK